MDRIFKLLNSLMIMGFCFTFFNCCYAEKFENFPEPYMSASEILVDYDRIYSMKSMIDYRECFVKDDLERKLDTLQKHEKALELEYDNCSWYQIFTRRDISKKLQKTRDKTKLIKATIKKNEDDLKSMKTVVGKLNGQLVSVFQISEGDKN